MKRYSSKIGIRKNLLPCTLAVLLCVPVLFTGCKNGGAQFRRFLRGTANSIGGSKGPSKSSKSGPEVQALAEKNSIKQCPAETVLRGAAFPKGIAQWCERKGKEGVSIKHGPYKRWHKNGNLRSEGMYDQNKLAGVIKEYSKDGRLKEQTSYAAGEKHGASVVWNKKGAKTMSGSYQNGKKSGKFAFWDKSGRMKEKGSFLNDLKHGVWTIYHRNSRIRSQTTWAQGHKNGKEIIHSRDGIVTSQKSYREDLPHGPWILYHRSGEKKSEGTYVAGQRNGLWFEYDRDGSMRRTMTFKNGAVVRQDSQYAQRKNRRHSRRRRSRFGSGDILGSDPPIRNTPRIVAVPTPDKPQPVNKGNGWAPL